MLRTLPLLLCALLACPPAHAADARRMVIARREVMVWEPEGKGPFPVILFSHAFNACAGQSEFLTTLLARKGYLVLAPNHADSRCLTRRRFPAMKPEERFKEPRNWSEDTYRDRGADLKAIAAELKNDPKWKDRADTGRLGLAGHSLGGYTALGLAGAWPGWHMPEVKAVLALSPYATPFMTRHTLGGLKAPVMYQGGTRDVGVTPAIVRPGGAYDQSPSPKYLVKFTFAGHLAWTDVQQNRHKAVTAYALAFFDHHVKGLPADGRLAAPIDEQVSLLMHDSDLGRRGRPQVTEKLEQDEVYDKASPPLRERKKR